MTFQEYQKENFNYECITTFWEDFSIADAFGIQAIKDTFKRAFEEWKTNYKYLTELVIVLNIKCWTHYGEGREDVSALYSEFYYKAKDYAYENLKGEELEYFYQITD